MKSIPRISTRGYYDLGTGKTIKDSQILSVSKKRF